MINILPARRPTKTFSNREDTLDDTITTIYYLCDEFLKTIRHRQDDPQVRLSTAEVMTVPLVAATFFGGNLDEARLFLEEYGYMPDMISKSHLNRRIHAIDPTLWRGLFALLAESFKQDDDPERTYYYYGYIPSKRRYFYGLRVHLVVTEAGESVEFSLVAGSEADVSVFKDLELDLPEGSIILADKAYTDYDYEDLLEEVGLHLKAQRKKNSKRPMAAWEEFLGKPVRQYIETVFGKLTNLFSRKIHAVTPRGFELKIVWFLLAFSIQCL